MDSVAGLAVACVSVLTLTAKNLSGMTRPEQRAFSIVASGQAGRATSRVRRKMLTANQAAEDLTFDSIPEPITVARPCRTLTGFLCRLAFTG